MAEGQTNYEHTIRRIVEEDFRLSKETIGIYDLYYNWIKSLKKEKRSEADIKYLKLYPSLPKRKASKKTEEEDI